VADARTRAVWPALRGKMGSTLVGETLSFFRYTAAVPVLRTLRVHGGMESGSEQRDESNSLT
jgi:hypothetical protein